MSSDRLDPTVPVRPGEDIDTGRLLEYLGVHLPDADLLGDGENDAILEIEQFPSGFSNLTYLLRLRYGDRPARELVLRRPPHGSEVKTAHDMGREYRILSKLRPIYRKVPEVFFYCEDPEVLGAPFYVMECLEGIVLRGGMSEQRAPSAPEMTAVATSLVETLAELHALDYRAAGLGEIGRAKGYVERQVVGWGQRWEGSRIDPVPTLDRTAQWLVEQAPEESGAALIHNDFKYDNLVLSIDDLSSVVGVLDWEMATVGDPMMDLGTSLGYWVDPGDPPALAELSLSPTTLPGNPRRVEIAELYGRYSGRSLESLVFYYAYGLFKIAVIIQQIYLRYRRGLTSDTRFAGLSQAVRALGQMSERSISLGRVDDLF